MTNVTLDLNAGEVWVQVTVGADHPCQWDFTMALDTVANITSGIPPMQNGPDKRPLGQPGTLINSGATWQLIISNLSKDMDLHYDAKVRVYQIDITGHESNVYQGPLLPPMPDTISANIAGDNPHTSGDYLKFLL